MTLPHSPLNDVPLPLQVYQQVVDQSPMAVCVTDVDAQIVHVNASFCALTGYSREEVIGRNTSTLAAGVTPQSRYTDLWSTIASGKVWRGLLVNARKDSSRYLAELTIAPVTDEHGQSLHYVAMHRDVSATKRLEMDLTNQRTITDTIVSQSPGAILLLDPEGEPLITNDALERLCLSIGCDVGHLLDIFAEHHPDALDLREPFDSVEISYQIRGLTTLKWLSFSGRGLDIHYGDDSFAVATPRRCALLTISDVTELRIEREESRINALTARLAEHALRANVRETIQAAMFHLQEPLNLCKGLLQVELQKEHPSSSIDRLQDIERTCASAIDKLRGALPDEHRRVKSPVNLNELAREILSLYTDELLSNGITVEWRPSVSPPTVLGDEITLGVMLRQLIDNSLHAMMTRTAEERCLTIETSQTEHEVSLQVLDSGPGISSELRTRVFEPLFSAGESDQKRSGIGLTLAHEIANDHSATIRIDDASNRQPPGCRVLLVFPSLRRTRLGWTTAP